MARRIAIAIVFVLLASIGWADCTTEKATNDERCTFEASAFLGLAIDTFSAGEYGNYVYPGHDKAAASGTEESSVFGFDFAFRMKGWRDSPADNYKRQLWIFGETVHGVRSADINCSTNKDFPSCQSSISGIVNPSNVGQTALYILRNASSLEGYAGFRFEFARLNDPGSNGGTPVNAYFKAQAGFLKVAGTPGSALDMHKIAVGLIASKGDYTGSYIDVGYGRNDVFQFNRRRRAIVDGYLQKKIFNSDFSFYAQMVVDTDLGKGSDSFQSYIGVSFDLGKLFAKATP